MLQQYLDITNFIIVVINQDETVKLINKKGLELLGYEENEIIGKNWFDNFIPAKNKEAVKASFQNIMNGRINEFEYCESPILSQNGQKIIISWHNALIKDEAGNILTVLSSGEDITERKQMEQELLKMQKIESLGILAGGIAHDFNNVLTGILGNVSFAKLLLDTEADKQEILEALENAEKASLQAKNLTQQLLTFSKGGFPIIKKDSITELLKTITNFTLRGANVRAYFNIPEDLWNVEIDEDQIGQVVQNIIVNALQAMPEGGMIQINAENVDIIKQNELLLSLGKYVKVSIKDHGTGINEEHLTKIFDPYFSTKPKGSGLGLSASFSILKKHKGYITVESKPGIGTTVIFFLPACETDIPAGNVLLKQNTGKRKILVMDDEEIIRKFLNKILFHFGYRVELAKDGNEAIDAYKKARDSADPFDLVLMDLTIPGGMGGKETIKKLIEFDPDVKAIVSSGYSSDPIMANFSEYGFVGVISKPYKVDELNDVLKSCILSILCHSELVSESRF